jgi:hypothetical protein
VAVWEGWRVNVGVAVNVGAGVNVGVSVGLIGASGSSSLVCKAAWVAVCAIISVAAVFVILAYNVPATSVSTYSGNALVAPGVTGGVPVWISASVMLAVGSGLTGRLQAEVNNMIAIMIGKKRRKEYDLDVNMILLTFSQ